MKWRQGLFLVTVTNTCFISFSSLRTLSCALKRRGENKEENQGLCSIHFREQLQVSVCCREKYHLCTSVSGRNTKHKLWKPSCIFPRAQPFRCKLLQFHCKTPCAEELSGQKRRKKWNRWISFAVSRWESSAEMLVQLYWFLHQQMADNIPCVCVPFGKSQVTSGLASVLSEQMEVRIRYRLQRDGEIIGRSVRGGGKEGGRS